MGIFYSVELEKNDNSRSQQLQREQHRNNGSSSANQKQIKYTIIFVHDCLHWLVLHDEYGIWYSVCTTSVRATIALQSVGKSERNGVKLSREQVPK